MKKKLFSSDKENLSVNNTKIMFQNFFREEAKSIFGKAKRVRGDFKRRFKVLFGVDEAVCIKLWTMIYSIDRNLKPAHLIWALLFLKCYANEDINCILVSVDNKTFRRWVWKVIGYISNIKQVFLLLFLIKFNLFNFFILFVISTNRFLFFWNF